MLCIIVFNYDLSEDILNSVKAIWKTIVSMEMAFKKSLAAREINL